MSSGNLRLNREVDLRYFRVSRTVSDLGEAGNDFIERILRIVDPEEVRNLVEMTGRNREAPLAAFGDILALSERIGRDRIFRAVLRALAENLSHAGIGDPELKLACGSVDGASVGSGDLNITRAQDGSGSVIIEHYAVAVVKTDDIDKLIDTALVEDVANGDRLRSVITLLKERDQRINFGL